jgi:hypothetical protein
VDAGRAIVELPRDLGIIESVLRTWMASRTLTRAAAATDFVLPSPRSWCMVRLRRELRVAPARGGDP